MISLDGTDDVINVANLAVPTTVGSVSFWWKSGDDITAGATLHSIFQVTVSSPELRIFEMFKYSDGRMYSGWYTATFGDRRHIWIPTGISTNTWYHWVLSWTQDGATALYVNNVAKTTLNPTDIAKTWDTSGATFKFGYDTTGPNYSDMQITDFRMFNRVLTAAERQTLYESRLKMGGITAGMVNYYPMDDQPAGDSADGDTMRDIVGGKNGTPDNGANNTGMSWGQETILSYPPAIEAA